ncbi:Polyubiquitin [Melia azedarach]|uniref:Polyubiquitin n=1 Tax=Melia azedarach TaxID=155640 RepID=A0ACC1YGE6_MELAZ|nr:Polyubiquitin [Melia azedarach]
MLRENEGISENLQVLSFDGQRLGVSGSSIMDYGILKNSTITVEELSWKKLYFTMSSNEKTIELKVRYTDSFHRIKSVIWEKEGIHSYQYSLYYAGKLVEDYRTVASLNIQSNEATLHLISNPEDGVLSIFAETQGKGTMKVKVRRMNTVLDVKKIVESSTNLHSED